ncbi:MAG: DUF4013 domain-containing protein [Candidatus Eremiobacterota bacterium]
MDITRSLTYPTRDAQWPLKIGVGAVASLLSILMIGTLFTTGYCMRVMRSVAANEEADLPDWNDLGSMLVQGLLGVVASLLYFAIPGALLAFGAGSILMGLFSAVSRESASPFAMGAGIGGILAVAGGLLFLLILFVWPMMLLRIAVTGSLGAAFDFGAILGGIMKALLEYVSILAVTLGLGLVLGFLLNMIPVAGTILFVAVSFYLNVAASHMLGSLYRTRLDTPTL